MKSVFFSLLAMGIWGIGALCQAVQVDGQCYLENQSSHEGTRVLFQADSPSAVTDSVFTDSSGYYQIDVSGGQYDVFFTHEGYYSEEILDRLLFSNTTLQTITLVDIIQNQISGALSGVVTAGTYRVVGDIFVQQGDSLIIEPGVEFQFDEGYSFDIDGYLEAVGTESDSIIFKTSYGATNWGGIDFNETADDSSRIGFCFITESNSRGIACILSSPTITYSTINNNSAEEGDEHGGGIYIWGGSPTIIGCTIKWNTASDGGGIYCWQSNAIIRNCIINNNSVGQGASSGGGIVCLGDSIIIEYCDISNNVGGWDSWGAGILCDSVTLKYCTITGNHFQYPYFGYGGGAYVDGNSTFINCTISGNSPGISGFGGGIFCSTDSLTLINTILNGNTGGGGVWFTISAVNSYLTYSDFYNNAGGNFIGNGIPPNLGQIVTQNANGDPCDAFFNIFLNPMLTGNFHLQAGSPCIDAGDPNSPLDPDSTIADIGAFFFDQSWVKDPREIPQSSEFRLSQNYPNPFNATTTISYDMPVRALVKVNIYNILGQHITILLNQISDLGTHHLTWNAADSPSGIYFIQLTTSTHTQTIKTVLLK